MTTARIIESLENMTCLRTKVIAGQVVTRWNQDAFEVGTWGRDFVTTDRAAEIILQNRD